MTIHEIGDQWAKQAYGCFVDSVEISLPGDGESQLNWSGMGVESFLVGIGKSTVTNDANTVTVETGEGKRFPVGAQVMIVKDDGTTRSADTPDGTPRKVTAVTGDVVTLDGAVLADADGTTNPIYLVYYEAETPVGIDNPQTGLVGQFVSASMGGQCVRSATINITNGHELVNYCFGTDALSGSHYIPGGRLEVEASIEIKKKKKNVGIYNDIQAFEPQDIKFILGDSTTRHLSISLPRVECSVPTISVPESGSIPVTFEGKAYQTALDAADEIKVEYL